MVRKKLLAIFTAALILLQSMTAFAKGVEVIYLTDTLPLEELFLSSVGKAASATDVSNAIDKYNKYFDIDLSPLDDVDYYYPVYEMLAGNKYNTLAAFERALEQAVCQELDLPSVMLRMAVDGVTSDTVKSGNITFYVQGGNFSDEAVGIAAIYKNGCLIKAGKTDISYRSAGEIPMGSITAENSADYKIRFFVWDSAENMIPHPYSLISNELYVSKNGSDVYPGTPEKPFATVERAMRAVSEFSGGMSEDITVNIDENEYFINSTLQFGKEHGGHNGHKVIYKGSGTGNAVLTGGINITGWTKYNKYLYSAPVDSSVTSVRAMYINGYPAERAKSKYLYKASTFNKVSGSKWDYDSITVSGTNIPKIKINPEDTELVWSISWAHHRTPVADISYGASSTNFIMDQPAFNVQKIKDSAEAEKAGYYNSNKEVGYRAKKEFYIENAFELLDEPGEFYFNRKEHRIYYYPYSGEDIVNSDTVIPVTNYLVNISGEGKNDRINNIAFKNIDFKYGAWNELDTQGICVGQADQIASLQPDVSGQYRDQMPAQINVEYADGVEFEGCGFYGLSANALNLDNAVSNADINGNVFCNIGGTAVRIGRYLNDTERDGYQLCNNITVQENVIRRAALETRSCAGIQFYYATDVTLTHNDISECPYSGISAGWGWGTVVPEQKNHVISYNKITNVMQTQRDGGHIYTLGPFQGSSNTINNNYIAVGNNTYGGIYLDQASRYITINNNVFSGLGRWLFVYVSNLTDISVKNTFTDNTDYLNNSASGVTVQTPKDTSVAINKKLADNAIKTSGISRAMPNLDAPSFIKPYNEFTPVSAYTGTEGNYDDGVIK